MPDVQYPSGLYDFTNLNKDSTHPNPYKPPSPLDQLMGVNNAAYKIYKPDFEQWALKGERNNMFNEGPFVKRLWNSGVVGFTVGCLYSYVDCFIILRSPNFKANLARFLYITPPVMSIPISFTASREALANQFGDKTWIYPASCIPGATIWGIFRQSVASGYKLFGVSALLVTLIKIAAQGNGLFDNNVWMMYKPPYARENTYNQWSYAWGQDLVRNADPGPTYKKFLEEDKK